MIKENIKILDNLRPEEARFNFNPLNRNLCFSVGGGGSGNPIENMFDAMFSPFGGGGSGGSGGTEEGGLSEEDKAFKKMLYDRLQPLLDQEYESYTGDRYADRSPEELALLEQLKEGGGYKDLYDKASTDLGFTKQAYKDAAGYGVDQLDQDASALMAGDTYRNEVAEMIKRDMGDLASRSGMDITGSAWGSDAGGTHSRGGSDGTARLQSNLGYHRQAGDALSKLHYGAYGDALNRARTLQQDRLGAAGKYGSTVMTDLGIGTGGLDKHYSSSMGAFGQDRGYLDRDLDVGYQDWKDKKNWDWKKLGYASGIYSGMPFEEKVVSQQPASGGK